MHLQFRSGTPSGYPASVSLAGLTSVWDLRVGGPIAVGPRSATTKVLGVDTLPAGATYSGGFLTCNGTMTFDNWDFTTIASNGYVETVGTGVVTFNDCKFALHAAPTAFYILLAGDSGTPTTICNYCSFDGNRTGGALLGAAVLAKYGSCQLNYCDVFDQPGDGVKLSFGSLTMRYCRLQACGWDIDSDPDCTQCAGGATDIQYCLYDVRDGGELGDSFPGQPLNNFHRCDTNAAAVTQMFVKHNIFVGIDGFGTIPGAYTSIDAIDLGAAETGVVDADFVLYENNVIQKGRNAYTYQDNGGATGRYPAMTSAQWVNNIDFDTSATIPVPG